MKDYYETAIRALEHCSLKSDPGSDGCTKLANLITQLQIKQKLEKEKPLSPERKRAASLKT